DGRVAGNMATVMPGERPGIDVVAAAGCKSYDDPHGLALVKSRHILGGDRARESQAEGQGGKCFGEIPLHDFANSISDVLQEPFCRDMAAETRLADEFVDSTSNGIELGALQIAAFRIGDLVAGGAALGLPTDDIGKRDAPVRQGVAVLTAAAAA